MSELVGTCERCACPIERGDLRCAICGLSTPDRAAQSEGLQIQVLRCEGCGAAVSYSASVGAPACAFCGSTMHLEELLDPPEQVEAWLPFRVSKQAAAAGLKRWLGTRGFFRPSDLASSSRLEALQPILWVGWLFDASCDVSWTADSNLGSLRSAWAPHSGHAKLDFERLLVSASRGLNDEEVDTLTPSYDVADTRPEPSAEPGGLVELDKVHLETFDVQRSAARRRITAAIEAAAEHRIGESHVPGTRCRNVHAAVLLHGLETRRLAFPAWVLAYRYKQRLYRVVVSGQDPSVICGDAPLSIGRILLVVGLSLVVLAIILALVAGH